MSEQPPTRPYQQMPQQPPTGPYEQMPGQPPWSGYPQGQDYPQGPAYPQGPEPYAPPPRRGGRHLLRNTLIAVGGVVVLLIVVGLIGSAVSKTTTVPGPTITVTQTATVAGPKVTVSVTPTVNSQGLATQISQDGVYVIGTDIPGGTWHTSGGQQCYEATLASTDTSNIIDNNNFIGPDTVNLSGAKAFDISGGCTWTHEG